MSFFEFSEKTNELSKIALKKAEEQFKVIEHDFTYELVLLTEQDPEATK